MSLNRHAAGLVALLFAGIAQARELRIDWEAPTQRCDGTAIESADLGVLELYLDTNPIAGPEQQSDGCSGAQYDPPEGFTPTTAPVSDGSVTVTAEAGKTYYARARISDAAGTWSNLTHQVSVTVPLPQIKTPAVLRITLQ